MTQADTITQRRDSVLLQAWKVINPRTLLMSVGAVFAGAATDVLRGNLDVLPGSLCLLFAIFAQIAGNAHHRYFDLTQMKDHILTGIGNHHPRQSGSPGDVSMFFLQKGALAAAIFAAMVGLSLLSTTGWWGLVFALIIVFLEWLANYSPHPLMRSPWGMVVTFLLFGPVCVLGTAMCQSEYVGTAYYSLKDFVPAFFMSVVMGLQAAECHLTFSYFNHDNARDQGDRTFVALFGKGVGRSVMLAMSITCVGTMIAMGFVVEHLTFSLSPAWLGYITVPFICAIVNTYALVRMPVAGVREQNRLRTLMCAKMAFSGIASYVAFWFVGMPTTPNTLLFG